MFDSNNYKSTSRKNICSFPIKSGVIAHFTADFVANWVREYGKVYGECSSRHRIQRHM